MCKKTIKISKEGLLGVAQVQRNGTERRHRTREYLELKGPIRMVKWNITGLPKSKPPELKQRIALVLCELWAGSWCIWHLGLSAAMDF